MSGSMRKGLICKEKTCYFSKLWYHQESLGLDMDAALREGNVPADKPSQETMACPWTTKNGRFQDLPFFMLEVDSEQIEALVSKFVDERPFCQYTDDRIPTVVHAGKTAWAVLERERKRSYDWIL